MSPTKNGYDDVDFEVIQRITTLESKEEQLSGRVEEHEHLIDKIDNKLNRVVESVKQIRNALYLMALVQAYQIPELKGVVAKILSLIP